jgi:hypothetical protein
MMWIWVSTQGESLLAGPLRWADIEASISTTLQVYIHFDVKLVNAMVWRISLWYCSKMSRQRATPWNGCFTIGRNVTLCNPSTFHQMGVRFTQGDALRAAANPSTSLLPSVTWCSNNGTETVVIHKVYRLTGVMTKNGDFAPKTYTYISHFDIRIFIL